MSVIDVDYVRSVAEQAADGLRAGKTFLVGYEPQNFTRYELVLVPLDERTLSEVRDRRPPILGIGELDGTYLLVGVVNRGTYAFNIKMLPVAHYIAEKLNVTPGDGEAIWILLRQIAKEL